MVQMRSMGVTPQPEEDSVVPVFTKKESFSMDMPLDLKTQNDFNTSVTKMRRLLGSFTVNLVRSEEAQLFALYKQATSGDISADATGAAVDLQAWLQLTGMSQGAALDAYVRYANKLATKYRI
eukprot:CAMPEP_0184644006 /NCGR_PEP_ID=MMETSP0308-20130426/796_1 /TAXON_ID=38269 /ORGANISM="Gloeochaete witrockiana, Strain SAG 46.84" /LENGTH=122 /DNA_ID=CAMNT_0027072297 /DNA_START=187 /DNA_END=555 /DNA_ORIENTATION=-